MRKHLYGLVLSMACITATAQDVPVADLLDVQYNADGTAVDISPKGMKVEYVGDGTIIAHNPYFDRVVATFNNPWAGAGTGYYRVNFEEDQEFRDALADGHSLEMLVEANYEGTIQNVEAKPFSAMQGGGTGFLVTTISGVRQNELCFLPNVSTTGASTWRWTTSGIVPRSGIYYHVIGVWNKEEGKAYIYVDGELKNTIDAPGDFRFAASGNNWFCVGGDPNGSSGHQSWNGDVVIARVYDKPLNAQEAAALWNAVESQEKAANTAAYMAIVTEGKEYLHELVATQSQMDEYLEALDKLEALTEDGTYAELDAQLMTVKEMRSQLDLSAAAYVKYKEHADAAIAYLEENDDFEGDDRDYIDSYLNDYTEPNEDYPHGSYAYIWDTHVMSTDDITAEGLWIDEKLAAAIANGIKLGSDITNLLTNATFSEGFTGWAGTVGTGTGKSTTTDYYGAETWARGFDMHQTITGLQPGVYVVTASAAYRPFDDRYSTYYAANMYANENRLFLPTVYETRLAVADAVDGENCYLTQVGDDAATDLEISEDGSDVATAYGIHGKTSIANAANGGRALNYLLANVTDSTLTIGFADPNPNAGSDWTGIANIRLIYAGTLEDANHYLDETLACMVARAETIINSVPDVGNYATNPGIPQEIRDRLKAAVAAVGTTTSPEEKYTLIGTFTQLWSDFMEGRAAYVKMIDEAEICYGIVSELKPAEKMTEEEASKAEDAIKAQWLAFEEGTFTTEQALALEDLKALGIIPATDENGVYQITNNAEMAYYTYKAGRTASAVNGKLLDDIDYFTESQMMENFYGTLDGNFHTITLNIHRDVNGAALINNMRAGSCVKNLTVNGEIHTSAKFATTVAANTYGATTISGITSTVNMFSTIAGDGTHGGFVGAMRGSTTVENCVFAGTMDGAATINSAGIIGWAGGGVAKIANCLQIADILMDPSGSNTLARYPENVLITNTYYKTPFGDVVGTQITDEQLASGEVCYLLNKGNTEDPVWFQTLGEDPYPVPNPSHQTVGKTKEGTYTNDPNLFYNETSQDEAPKADLLDVVFHEDGTAEDVSPMQNEVQLFGETSTTYYNDTYQRYAARFVNPWGSTATGYYKVDFENNMEFRNALADGHSLEILCLPDYVAPIANVEAKPFAAHQGGGTGLMVCTKSGTRENEWTFLPNVTETGASTWRWATSGVVPQPQVFYHVVGVWNAEEGKSYIYVNGELKNTIASPGLFKFASAGCNWFGIGGDAGTGAAGPAWTGDIAIARVYDKPLTQADVTNLWDKVLHPNAIDEITESKPTAPRGIFNLNGMRVEKPQHGVYIIDGKKKLVK